MNVVVGRDPDDCNVRGDVAGVDLALLHGHVCVGPVALFAVGRRFGAVATSFIS
jgi:hypothetical protein